jgi:hypothetical protein
MRLEFEIDRFENSNTKLQMIRYISQRPSSVGRRYFGDARNQMRKVGLSKIIALLTVVAFSLVFWLERQKGSPEAPDDEVKRQQASAEVEMLSDAVVKFANDQKQFPGSLNDLVPNYIAVVPTDPYGREYLLISNGDMGRFVMYHGKDGRAKGFAASDKDIGRYVAKTESGFVLQQ